MPVRLKDIIADRSLLESESKQSQKCPYCSCELQETITGKRKTPRGFACSDCYYDEFSELVEGTPITVGRIRRG